MAKTDRFRKQHEDMLATVALLAPSLTAEKLGAGSGAVRATLAKLSGQLMIHLAMEDESLYPALVASADPKLSALAKTFAKEMGTLKAKSDAYFKKWAKSGVIEGASAEFIRETNELVAALGDRIRRENNELYKAADAQR